MSDYNNDQESFGRITLNSNLNCIQKFPKKTRLIISSIIYSLIDSENLTNNTIITLNLIHKLIFNDKWDQLFSKNDLTYLRKKYLDVRYTEPLRKYFEDLAYIIYKLYEFNKNDKILNVKKFCEHLINVNHGLCSVYSSLRGTIPDIVNFLNANIDSFSLQSKTKEFNYDDGSLRQCNICNEFKEYTQFSITGGGWLRSVCKDCNNRIYAIEYHSKKLNVLVNIYKGKFNNKCCYCDNDLIILPALSLHHRDPLKKLNSLHKLLKSSLDYFEIINILEPENVELVCRNCHRIIHSILNDYDFINQFIIHPSLFDKNLEEIENEIWSLLKQNKLTSHLTEQRQSRIKQRVISLIKKRVVIKYLYDGKCVGCEDIDVTNNIMSLEFHHIMNNEDFLNEKAKLRWTDIEHLNILDIIRLLKSENCVTLCANCHIFLHSNAFVDFSSKILNEKLGEIVKTSHQSIKNNVKKYKIVEKNNLLPLIYEFALDKAWKKALVCSYQITESKNLNEFNASELANCLNINQTSVTYQLNQLLELRFIGRIKHKNLQHNIKLYRITNQGYTELDSILSFFNTFD